MRSGGTFCAVPVGGEVGGKLRSPEFAPYQRESVAEGWLRLAIPSHALDHWSALGGKLAGPQCHEGE
jgi:hypothetical protein